MALVTAVARVQALAQALPNITGFTKKTKAVEKEQDKDQIPSCCGSTKTKRPIAKKQQCDTEADIKRQKNK